MLFLMYGACSPDGTALSSSIIRSPPSLITPLLFTLGPTLGNYPALIRHKALFIPRWQQWQRRRWRRRRRWKWRCHDGSEQRREQRDDASAAAAATDSAWGETGVLSSPTAQNAWGRDVRTPLHFKAPMIKPAPDLTPLSCVNVDQGWFL
jgi:hypothetical protein